MLKPNVLWTISKAFIIPEVITTCLLFIWKPFTAFIEITLVILSIVFSCRSIQSKSKKRNLQSRIKRLMRGINVNILLSSIILTPGIFIMIPYLTNTNKSLVTIPSHNISQTTEYSIAPNKWNRMTTTQKTEFIYKFSEIQAVELNMETVPTIKIGYMPWALYGSYSRQDDLILINAGIVQENNAEQIVKIISHELFHRYEHTLVEDYSNGLLPSDNLSDDVIDRIEGYSRDFENYSPGGITEESYNKYYSQLCEIDARSYADLIARKYFNT